DAFHPELPPPVDHKTQPGTEAHAVELFLKAVLDGTRVRFLYRTPYRAAGAADAVEAEPLGLLWDRDRWYLIGRKVTVGSARAEQRFWRADRVVEIEASGFRA